MLVRLDGTIVQSKSETPAVMCEADFALEAKQLKVATLDPMEQTVSALIQDCLGAILSVVDEQAACLANHFVDRHDSISVMTVMGFEGPDAKRLEDRL
jgi:hypothetical protein